MGLSLSTSAAPKIGIEAFGAACLGRGLEGGELALAAGDDAERLAAGLEASGSRVVTLRVETLDEPRAVALAPLAARLGAPVSVPLRGVVLGELTRIAARLDGAGAHLLIGVSTDLDEALVALSAVREAAGRARLGIGWDVRPSSEDLADASTVLFAVRQHLGLVRLHGGGPEQRAQEGCGVGALLADLALTGFTGPIVLCPSAPDTLPQWSSWLASRKIAGCGTRAESDLLALDVRDVEPRYRLEAILGAYRALARGATMRLTVDHDPSCMAYTLEATEAEGSFAFRTVENGPEVWRAEVTKL